MATLTIKQLERAVTDAEAQHRAACRAVYGQRPIAQAAINEDILVRIGGPHVIPPPRGPDLKPPRGPTSDMREREAAKLNELEGKMSFAAVALNRARAELLDAQNEIIAMERERLADDGSDEALLALQQLCPDERQVRITERFTLSPKVQAVLARYRGIRNDIDTPVNELQLGVDTDWAAARERALAAA